MAVPIQPISPMPFQRSASYGAAPSRMRRTRVEEACSPRNFRACSRSDFWSAEKSKFMARGSYGISWGLRHRRFPGEGPVEGVHGIVRAALQQIDGQESSEDPLPVPAEHGDRIQDFLELRLGDLGGHHARDPLETRPLDDPNEPQGLRADLPGLEDVSVARDALAVSGARISPDAAVPKAHGDLRHRIELEPVEILAQRGHESLIVHPLGEIFDRYRDRLVHAPW